MDPEKNAFVSGLAGGATDPDVSPGVAAIREAVANQIRDDDPAEVWQTARRLLGSGLDAADVRGQLTMTLTAHTMRVLEEQQRFDRAGYVDALQRLPLPAAERVADVVLDLVEQRQPVSAEVVRSLAAERLGFAAGDPLAETLLDRVEESLLEPDEGGPLAMLHPDRLLHVPALMRGVVLTHRLSASERESDALEAVDLPGFARAGLRYQGEEISDYVGENGLPRWLGPANWLEPLVDGALLALRVDSDGEVSIDALAEEPVASGELVAAIRQAYETELAEPWLPVSAEDLLLGVLAAEPGAFARPEPPLSELAAAAGLERRGSYYAHEESVWREGRLTDRDFRVFNRLGTSDDAARSVLEMLNTLEEGIPGARSARELLRELGDPDVAEVVAGELNREDSVPGTDLPLGELAERFVQAASHPADVAVAHWFAALAEERTGAVSDAESHLRAAVRAEPGWPLAEERLAWYESDRGDAGAAAERWRRIGYTPQDNDTLATVEPFAAASAAPKLGRNDPCWCGSGRKYKVCHLRQPARAPLPDRVGWLARKAVAYLEHQMAEVGAVAAAHAAARAADPDDPDSVAAAFSDPLVFDALLHEGGWFERFLADRGPLLPDDEAMLARSWTLVDRTVCEVVDARPGGGVTVRDLRTGDRTEVRERTFSRETRTGELVCARVVPDGESHQFIGGIFRVSPGTERGLLELLDRHDGCELLNYAAELERPPALVTSDGDPLLDGRAELDVPDPAAAPADRQERKWCAERIPALGGYTPREAAEDPTRREELERLLASFPEVDPESGALALRPARLRELLGLRAGGDEPEAG